MKITKLWGLPKPKKIEGKYQWMTIVSPRGFGARSDPWGYDRSEEDPDLLIPDEKALELLEEAKKLLKKYERKEVAEWLSVKSGRKITPQGLADRIRLEQNYRRRASQQRHYQRVAEEAAKKAEALERKIGGKAVRIPRG